MKPCVITYTSAPASQRSESPQGKSSDEFDLLVEYFTGNSEQVLKNVEIMESYSDCWCHIDGYASPAEFLSSFMSHTHEDGKIVVDSANSQSWTAACESLAYRSSQTA